jgi:hypothetical protein
VREASKANQQKRGRKIVKISDDVNDVDKFRAQRRRKQQQKNLRLAQRIKNQQSALINVWRMSGIDAERFFVESISFLPFLALVAIVISTIFSAHENSGR